MIDATRLEDGELVYIKLTRTDNEEVKIAQLLYNDALRYDPRNHCVPILEVFQDNVDPSLTYVVMPFLRSMNSPPFEFVEEIVSFIDQILDVSDSYVSRHVL